MSRLAPDEASSAEVEEAFAFEQPTRLATAAETSSFRSESAPAESSRGPLEVPRPGARQAVFATAPAKTRSMMPFLVAGALVALIACVFAFATCAGNPSDSVASTGYVSERVTEMALWAEEKGPLLKKAVDDREPDEEAIANLIGQEEAEKLIERAETDEKARWIAAHVDELDTDGIEVQSKLLMLAADEPPADDYILEFPDRYPVEEPIEGPRLAMSEDSPSADVPSTKIPHLYQWDRRWAYTTYSSASFGLTGCGPTSLAMVYQGVTGKRDKTPYDLGVLAAQYGYMTMYNGTPASFFAGVAPELGMNCWEISVDSYAVTQALKDGHPIIANLGIGVFSRSGHYFVLTGLADDGKVIINDPYSVVRSSQTWDLNVILDNSLGMYAFSAA